MMYGPDLVQFVEKDKLPSHLKDVIHRFLKLFTHRHTEEFMYDFMTLFTLSKRWNVGNVDNKLNEFKSYFCHEESKEDRENAFNLISESFNLCQNDDDFKKLRGEIFETIIVGKFSGTKVLEENDQFKAPHYGWGCEVKLHSPKSEYTVRYYCRNNSLIPGALPEFCQRRNTVDYGEWDGLAGVFIECKVSPYLIGCKEFNYLQELKNVLERNSISYKIYYACSTSRRSICNHLSRIGNDYEKMFHYLGSEDLA